MEDIPKIFHIEWKILLAQSVNFGLVVFLLWRYAFGPIGKVLNDRSAKIEGGLRMAEEAKKNLAEAEEKTKGIIQEAKRESERIVKEAFDEAEKLRAEELARSKEESIKIIEAGKNSLLAEKDKIVGAIRQEMAELVVSASTATLRGVSDEKIDKVMAEKALTNLEES